jgi:hypothetical protein
MVFLQLLLLLGLSSSHHPQLQLLWGGSLPVVVAVAVAAAPATDGSTSSSCSGLISCCLYLCKSLLLSAAARHASGCGCLRTLLQCAAISTQQRQGVQLLLLRLTASAVLLSCPLAHKATKRSCRCWLTEAPIGTTYTASCSCCCSYC